MQGKVLRYVTETSVRYAKVTFTDQSDTTKQYSTLTDTAGHYQLSIITGVTQDKPSVPTAIELAQNYPNPFSSSTAISYRLNKQTDVNVTIYDILGREVKRFMVGLQTTGVHRVIWDGKNAAGEKVAAGVYFYRLHSANETYVKKMLLGFGGMGVNPIISQKGFVQTNDFRKANNITQKVMSGGTFTVRITNTDTTSPEMVPAEFTDITIAKDTTLDFTVQVEQWKSLGLENEQVTAIAVDPVNPDVIYAGTLYDFSGGINGKLFKSTNAGTTWDTLLIGGGYRDMIIDPNNHNTIYALPGSIIKSTDAGNTWQTKIDGITFSNNRATCIAINPKNSNVLYVGTGGIGGSGGLYKSYDGGERWNKIQFDSLGGGVWTLALDPVDTGTVYAATISYVLWKSTNGGESWFRTGLTPFGVYDVFPNDILIDPLTPSTLYAGVAGFCKSEDWGLNWQY